MIDLVPTGWISRRQNPDGSWSFVYRDGTVMTAHGYFSGGFFVTTNVAA